MLFTMEFWENVSWIGHQMSCDDTYAADLVFPTNDNVSLAPQHDSGISSRSWDIDYNAKSIRKWSIQNACRIEFSEHRPSMLLWGSETRSHWEVWKIPRVLPLQQRGLWDFLLEQTEPALQFECEKHYGSWGNVSGFLNDMLLVTKISFECSKAFIHLFICSFGAQKSSLLHVDSRWDSVWPLNWLFAVRMFVI